MYKINNCYPEFIQNREAILLNLSADKGLTLKFLWKNPNENVIENFKIEPFFQLFFKNDVAFLLLKFNKLKWVDIPLLFNNGTDEEFYSYEETLPVDILLFNSNTGKLFVYEKYFMPKGITKAFIQTVHTQKKLNKKEIIRRINKIHSSFSSDEMARLSLGSHK